MIPTDELSEKALIAGFSFPVKSAAGPDKLKAWELGGVALNDPSQGLRVKLWEGSLEFDNDTGEGRVYVKAPGVAKTLLFSGADISEIDIAFDQNMHPFVAYQQGSAAKIYWHDPTIPGMTHSTLPAGSYSLRCTLDQKQRYDVASSDVVLCYIRSGTLYRVYQRDRYGSEKALRTGIGADAELVSLAMNVQSKLQWHLRHYTKTDDPGALVMSAPFLAEVVLDLCRRAGIPQQNVDVTELWKDIVQGLKIDTDDGHTVPLDQLREVFFFDKSDYDRKLHFPKRGRGVVARIPYEHLVRGNPVALKQEREDETDLAREVFVNHLDPDGGFAKNKQFAQRRSNLINAEEKKNIQTQVVLTVDQAATTADTKLRIDWNELIEYTFSTTIRYTYLTIGDVVEVEDALGTWHRMRLEERNEDGNIEWKATQDAGERTYGSARVGNTLAPPTSTTPGLVGETRIEIVNCSPLRDQDDELGLYVAAAGESSAWTGYQMLVSTDGGTSYAEAYQASAPSTIGETVTDLPASLGYEYQSQQAVEVLVNFPLASISYDQLLVNQNRIVLGDELAQYTTATLLGMVGSLYHYRLSGLLRGRYATATPHWPAGTRFVLVDETLVFAQAQRAMLGQDLLYKPVSFGLTEDETTPTAYLFDEPASQTEWPVTLVRAERKAIDLVVATRWVGVARLGNDTNPFHSKYFAGYRVKYSDGQTVDTMDQNHSRIAPANIGVQVCALNSITGEGPYSPTIIVP